MKMKKSLFVTAVAVSLTACGGGGGMPNFGNDEYPVETIGTNSASLQSTYPATIRGIQDVQVRPKVSGFITKVYVHEGQVKCCLPSIVRHIGPQFGRLKPALTLLVHS